MCRVSEEKVSLKGYGKFADAGSKPERQWDALPCNQMIAIVYYYFCGVSVMVVVVGTVIFLHYFAIR